MTDREVEFSFLGFFVGISASAFAMDQGFAVSVFPLIIGLLPLNAILRGAQPTGNSGQLPSPES